MIAVNAAMPKLLGLYETHLTVADLKDLPTDFYRDVVGLESAASFRGSAKSLPLGGRQERLGMLGLWETGTGPPEDAAAYCLPA